MRLDEAEPGGDAERLRGGAGHVHHEHAVRDAGHVPVHVYRVHLVLQLQVRGASDVALVPDYELGTEESFAISLYKQL